MTDEGIFGEALTGIEELEADAAHFALLQDGRADTALETFARQFYQFAF